MDKFVMKKSTEANIYKSIRFPVEINSQIIEIVDKANEGLDKKESMVKTLNYNAASIFISGLCFFGATFGVGAYSKIEMIGSLCTLMSRGAIISVLVVITVLPAMLMIFDKLVCKTTSKMKECK